MATLDTGFRSAVFDIETTSLDAVGAGVILCAVVKELGKSPIVYRYDDMKQAPGNDLRLVRALLNELGNYSLLIGHNIDNFDWNFIRTRAMIHGLSMPQPPLGYDTLTAFKRTGFKTVPNIKGRPTGRLDHVVDMFGIPQMKTALYPREHWQTVWGNKEQRREAMHKLVEHCIYDCEMNEQVFYRLFQNDSGATLKRLK